MRRSKVIKVIVGVMVLLVVAGAGTAYYLYGTYKDIKEDPAAVFQKKEQPTVPPEKQEIQIADPNGGEAVVKKYNDDIILLGLFGIDTDADRTQRNMGWRSDTMIVCVLDTSNNTAKMITCPRDTRTMVKKLDNNGNVTSEGINKLNAAFAFGKGRDKYSYINAMDAISELFKQNDVEIPPITKYAGMDMTGIAPVADALDGVTITMIDTMQGIGSKGETVTLKGKDAETYVRTRKGKGLTGSDLDRTKRQQVFIKGMAKRIKEMGAIEAIPKLLQQLVTYIDTNLNTDEVIALATLLNNIDIDEIEFMTVPGEAEYLNGVWYWIVDEAALRDMIIGVFYEDAAHAPVSANQ